MLLLFLLLMNFHISYNINPFLQYLDDFQNPGSLSNVFEDPINRQYKFGLPPFFIGSKIMKLEYKIYFNQSVDGLFWSKVKQWIISTLRYYCDNWTCCVNRKSCDASKSIPKNGELIMNMLGNIQFSLPFRYLVIWCEMAWKEFYNNVFLKIDTMVILHVIKKFCPNSCASNPCSTKEGVDDSVGCQLYGMYIGEYGCKCTFNMEWNKYGGFCVGLNPCDQQKYSVCDKSGTEECVAISKDEYKCICKEEKMGFDCTQDRDACFENFDSTVKNGNYYCNVGLANKCIPYLGTNFYKCQCNSQYTANLNVNFDNCLKPVDACIYVVCMNGGQCTTSPDQTEVACLCQQDRYGNPMFNGKYCEISVGHWSSWTRWTLCRPKCGQVRYKLRKRKCLNVTSFCEGLNEEVAPCDEEVKPCPEFSMSGSDKSEIIDYFGLTFLALIVIVQIAGTFFVAQFLLLNRNLIFPTFMKICCRCFSKPKKKK